MSTKISRRTLLKAGMGSALFAGGLINVVNADSKESKEVTKSASNRMNVAVVQFRSSSDLADNVKRHCDFIKQCSKDGSRVVVFPECSVTGFFNEVVNKTSAAELDNAIEQICLAAKEADTYAIVGCPTKTGTIAYNSAVVITPKGKVIERYHKVHLAGEDWATSGDHISVFPIDGVLCSIIVCHDERYPELVRLPVLAGSRVVFYISSESSVANEHKMAPYRAQIMARAAENTVCIAHSNPPAEKDNPDSSHGQSRLIAADGNLIKEASIFDEEVITTSFNLNSSTGSLARQSPKCEFLKSWWENGVSVVRVIKDA